MGGPEGQARRHRAGQHRRWAQRSPSAVERGSSLSCQRSSHSALSCPPVISAPACSASLQRGRRRGARQLARPQGQTTPSGRPPSALAAACPPRRQRSQSGAGGALHGLARDAAIEGLRGQRGHPFGQAAVLALQRTESGVHLRGCGELWGQGSRQVLGRRQRPPAVLRSDRLPTAPWRPAPTSAPAPPPPRCGPRRPALHSCARATGARSRRRGSARRPRPAPRWRASRGRPPPPPAATVRRHWRSWLRCGWAGGWQ